MSDPILKKIRFELDFSKLKQRILENEIDKFHTNLPHRKFIKVTNVDIVYFDQALTTDWQFSDPYCFDLRLDDTLTIRHSDFNTDRTLIRIFNMLDEIEFKHAFYVHLRDSKIYKVTKNSHTFQRTLITKEEIQREWEIEVQKFLEFQNSLTLQKYTLGYITVID